MHILQTRARRAHRHPPNWHIFPKCWQCISNTNVYSRKCTFSNPAPHRHPLSGYLSGSLSGSLWLTLALSGSLWLTLAHSGSLWLTLALSGPLWLSLGHSGYLWLALRPSGRLITKERLAWPHIFSMFCCKTVEYDSVLSRNVKIRYFLSRNVKIRAMSRKNGINYATSWLRILFCSGSAHIIL